MAIRPKWVQTQLQEQNKCYVTEASELGLPVGVMDPRLFLGGMEFWYYATERDASDEDIAGWRFRPTVATVQKSPTFAGWTVLIIND